MASPTHVVAIPYPGRGHINPMLILARLLAARLPPPATITIVVTDEWLSLLAGTSAAIPGVTFRTIANVLPSEKNRAANYAEFIEAVFTKMESPIERLLDGLETPATAIIADIFLPWAADVGKRREIPVCSLITISATLFSAFLFFDRLPLTAESQVADILAGDQEEVMKEEEEEDELISKYIDGHQSLRLSDLNSIKSFPKPAQIALKSISQSTKSKCLVFTTAVDLEPRIITALRSSLPLPILPVGPTIPYSDLHTKLSNAEEPAYLTFLNSQPQKSVLYVSLGSFLSVPTSQMHEIAHGLQASKVKFLWVARDDASRLNETIGGGGGVFVTWCDQLKVLCHPSVGGFLTHCGWNSTMESAFAGVPVLTFPIMYDQGGNSRVAVEEWGVGMEMRGGGEVVGREKVAEFVRRLMGLEGGEMRKKGMKLAEACRSAVEEGGSSSGNLKELVKLLSPEI